MRAAWLVSACVLAAGGLQASGASAQEPQPPDVVTRDAEGHATIRAVRVTSPIRIDGALDETLYSGPSIGGWSQLEPEIGAKPSEETEAWIGFDDDNFYVAFKIWDSHPEKRVATEMRRDVNNYINGNDMVQVFFDTFYDRRNGISLTINSLGARNDGQVLNGLGYNGDWNPIWDLATGKFDGGWTIELAFPFRSLRYRPGKTQVWGFNALRTVRWRNEYSVLTPVPRGRGAGSAQYAGLAATVVGLEAPPPAKNLDIKPYAISTLSSDRNARPQVANDLGKDVGLDVKYGITQNLTADFTYNTDFAQVEADEQQINLTRFSLFFPEKREFFLENRDIFSFGSSQNFGGDTPQLFYSRRIGLDAGRPVPIQGGGRLTGRVGRYSVGAMNIQTDDSSTGALATNFSVLRVKRDILRGSSIGMMATRRSIGQTQPSANNAYGVDGAFKFFNDLNIDTYWARSQSDGLTSDDRSYRAALSYPGDKYGVTLERLAVGANFNPEVGYVRRLDARRTDAEFRFSPRPKGIPGVRRLVSTVTYDAFDNGSTGRLDTRERSGEFAVEFQNADRIGLFGGNFHEFVPRPFRIGANVLVPVGAYDWNTARLTYNMGPQRRVPANLSAEYGSFYNGHRSSLGISRGRLSLNPHLSIEPTYSMNHVHLLGGDAEFTTHLAGSRVTYTVSPRMFASALVQYNSTANVMTANVRFRWEYQPGSELFVVYNDERDTRFSGFPEMMTRSFIVKINRLFRF